MSPFLARRYGALTRKVGQRESAFIQGPVENGDCLTGRPRLGDSGMHHPGDARKG